MSIVTNMIRSNIILREKHNFMFDLFFIRMCVCAKLFVDEYCVINNLRVKYFVALLLYYTTRNLNIIIHGRNF